MAGIFSIQLSWTLRERLGPDHPCILPIIHLTPSRMEVGMLGAAELRFWA